ncbi:MAG: hypothetical protein CL850_03955 [Crocinitomicaceae bacterium]|nr:hypothetical protein [Crocinitomicaceae bacterium]
MIRNPNSARISLMKECQTLLNNGTDVKSHRDGIMLSYTGPLSDKTTNSIVDLTENSVRQCGVPRAELLRTKSVVSDSLKWFNSNGWIDDKGETEIYLIVECAENIINVKCGGLYENKNTDLLKEKIDTINSMSISDLRKSSIELICKTEDIDNNNSELRLMNIALNCYRPIDYKVEQKENGTILLSVDLIINHA